MSGQDRRLGFQPRRHGLPDPLLHRVHRTGIFPGPAVALRRPPQPGRELRDPDHPDRRRCCRRKAPHITPADFSIVNQPGASSYPISGYSWALIYTHQTGQATGQKLVTMLDWLTHAGQAYAAANGYVALLPQIQQLAHTMLQQITGPAGAHLLG